MADQPTDIEVRRLRRLLGEALTEFDNATTGNGLVCAHELGQGWWPEEARQCLAESPVVHLGDRVSVPGEFVVLGWNPDRNAVTISPVEGGLGGYVAVELLTVVSSEPADPVEADRD